MARRLCQPQDQLLKKCKENPPRMFIWLLGHCAGQVALALALISWIAQPNLFKKLPWRIALS